MAPRLFCICSTSLTLFVAAHFFAGSVILMWIVFA
jgi:hypothetical protein